MKLNRKWILVLSLVLSVAIATGSTLAYMTATTEKVTNTFTLGNVTITLTEPAWGNNSDPHPLYPGTPVAKDPTITNTGRTNAWVWMEMTVPAEVYPYLEFQTIDTSAWIIDDDDVDTTGKVTLLYRSTLAPNGKATPFTAVELAEDANLPNTLDSFNIEIVAYAIQDKPFDDVEEAYQAFKRDAVGADEWDGTADTTWYDESATEFEIATAEGLAGLAKLVNDGTTDFAGKTIKLTSNIDLNEVAWTPVGTLSFDKEAIEGEFTYGYKFKGTFDGQGNTIYNMKVHDADANGVALFALAENATIKNVNVENVDLNAGSAIAPILAKSNGVCTIENCHVSGDISIVGDWAYVSGILAKGNANISDCTVIADNEGLIKATNRNAVGGIVGWWDNGGSVSTMSNCTVKNINVNGWANVGGLAGSMLNNHTITGCTVEDVSLTKTRDGGSASIGWAAGGWLGSDTNASLTILVTNSTFKNMSRTGNHIAEDDPRDIYDFCGSEYVNMHRVNGTVALNIPQSTNNTMTNVVDNLTEK